MWELDLGNCHRIGGTEHYDLKDDLESTFRDLKYSGLTGSRGDCGDLFLDNIDELPIDAQARLARYLELGAFSDRFNSGGALRVSPRVIAASNMDLYSLMGSGQFNKKLYYLLFGGFIFVPPLRERPADISALAKHFVRLLDLGEFSISIEAMNWLTEQPFPGNARELRNKIEKACLIAKNENRNQVQQYDFLKHEGLS